VRVYEFNGAMFNSGDLPPANGPISCGATAADPVDCATGIFLHRGTDLFLPDTIPISLTRTYNSGDKDFRSIGIGTSLPYDMFLHTDNPYQEVDLILPDGGRVHYKRVAPGNTWRGTWEHTSSPTIFYKSIIYSTGGAVLGFGGWELKLRDGTKLQFPQYGRLAAIEDRFGNRLTIDRDGNRIRQITSPNGRWIRLTYRDDDFGDSEVIAKDDSGRSVHYTIDPDQHLTKVVDAAGGTSSYTYDEDGRMRTVENPRRIVAVTNDYDSEGRVLKQTLPDDSTWQFDYTTDTDDHISETVVTNPRGIQRRLTFNASGYPLTDTAAFGKKEEQTTSYVLDPASNRMTQVTDQLGRTTSLGYDDRGNLNSLTRLLGTPNPQEFRITYDTQFNQPTSITDPLEHTTTISYDTNGALRAITDPLNRTTNIVADAAGRPKEITDPLGNTTKLTYDGADLVAVTDPLGHTQRRWVDPAGRPIYAIDADGNATITRFDALNRPTSIIDALGNSTIIGYDPNGNRTSVTDARGATTTFTYDERDQLASFTDSLGKTQTYDYDANSNLTKLVSRRGKTTIITPDVLDRSTLIRYGVAGESEESSSEFTYDDGNRLTKIVDSAAGTTTFTPDDLDRLLTTTSPQGTVAYTYDHADRRKTMTVAGQPEITYDYNDANQVE
jgi:YD repeat-containing protein